MCLNCGSCDFSTTKSARSISEMDDLCELKLTGGSNAIVGLTKLLADIIALLHFERMIVLN